MNQKKKCFGKIFAALSLIVLVSGVGLSATTTFTQNSTVNLTAENTLLGFNQETNLTNVSIETDRLNASEGSFISDNSGGEKINISFNTYKPNASTGNTAYGFDTHDGSSVSFNVTGLESDSDYELLKDGTQENTFTSSSTGSVKFTVDSFSGNTYELKNFLKSSGGSSPPFQGETTVKFEGTTLSISEGNSTTGQFKILNSAEATNNVVVTLPDDGDCRYFQVQERLGSGLDNSDVFTDKGIYSLTRPVIGAETSELNVDFRVDVSEAEDLNRSKALSCSPDLYVEKGMSEDLSFDAVFSEQPKGQGLSVGSDVVFGGIVALIVVGVAAVLARRRNII